MSAAAALEGLAGDLVIDATSPPGLSRPLDFPIGSRSPDGRILSSNSTELTLDGQPWFPVIGEFHYSRYPRAEWDPELLKMKAGGITVVSSYVFWIHHEEVQGHFDWSGSRNLRAFVELCRRRGLLVWIRIGPWAHGEVRNGGFPDWLVQSRIPLRGNDPRYLALVRRLYGEIGAQLAGQFWSEGGPIVGVQIENEYHPEAGGFEHMRALRRLALESGIHPPFFSATGWDNAAVPPTGFLPVFGGYTEQFWSGSLERLPPNQNFFFTPIRAEDNVMGDLSPKNPAYNSKYEGYPFLTAEMGAGMAVAYHRRPLMGADDSAASAVVKLGSGINGLGFYMYHGGTNPDGLTPLQETQSAWNGYNDMEAKSYDFQAPLGEFGQVGPTYRALKTLTLFLDQFGSSLARMRAYFPKVRPADRDDILTPRVAARTDGQSGFLFINNYERNHPLGPKRGFRVALRLPSQTLLVPDRPTVVPDGAYPIWPVNLDLGGVNLRYATAQLLCRVRNPETVVFFAWPGLPVEFSFDARNGLKVDAPQARVARSADVVSVSDVIPGTSAAIRLEPDSRQTAVQIVVLTRSQALDLWTAELSGRQRLLLSPADLSFDGDRILLASRKAGDVGLGIFPAVRELSPPFAQSGADGIFRAFAGSFPRPMPGARLEVTKLREAAPSEPARLSPEPRAVAMEPDDRAFERAAVWLIRLRGVEPDTPVPALLSIRYTGDVARIYAGSRLVDDNFYKGTAWEVGLWRISPEELRKGLRLEILPLRRDAPVYLEPSARPNFSSGTDALELDGVDLVWNCRLEARIRD